VQLKVSNRYSIFEEVNGEKGCLIHMAVNNNVVKNRSCDKNYFINREVLNEQNKVINKTVWNPSDQQEHQCVQGLSTRSQDTEGKKCFKIPTLISGSPVVSKNDTAQPCRRKNSTSKGSTNSISRVQHKVFILGDSHLRGSVVKLINELSVKFEVSGVIRPELVLKKL
jgi:hypothetical protein